MGNLSEPVIGQAAVELDTRFGGWGGYPSGHPFRGASMGPIGIPELIIVLVILLVIFGPKRLPGLGRSLGSGMREFKDSISGKGGRDDDDEDVDEDREAQRRRTEAA